MTAKMSYEFERQLNEHLAPGGYLTTTGRQMVMEVREVATDLVWMSTEPVSREYFENLQLGEGLVKVGAAMASMDCAGFQHSPDREGEPVLQRIINGQTYINVARPMQPVFSKEPDGPVQVQVEKSHVIGFRAGRSVAILTLPAGHFVEVVGDERQDDSLVLPAMGELTSIELTEPWIVELPMPTHTFFWFGHGIRSFQGPVTLPSD